MSLFNTQKKKTTNAKAGETKISKPSKSVAPKAIVKTPVKAVAKTTSEKRATAARGITFAKGSPIIKPRITEKSGILSGQGVYVFDVRMDVNSKQISAAITEAYKVVPVKINLSAVKSKAMFVRGKQGKTVSGKKAYVFLKKGDTIEFI